MMYVQNIIRLNIFSPILFFLLHLLFWAVISISTEYAFLFVLVYTGAKHVVVEMDY